MEVDLVSSDQVYMSKLELLDDPFLPSSTNTLFRIMQQFIHGGPFKNRGP